MKRYWILLLTVPLLFSVPLVLAAEGDFVGQWDTGDANIPWGITTDGLNIYIADSEFDQVYKYTMAGAQLSNFSMTGINNDPRGIATDGVFIWVLDRTDREVYKYLMDGTYIISFDTNGVADDPYGITTDGEFIYIVSTAAVDAVYQFTMNGTATGESFSVDVETNAARGLTTGGLRMWVADDGDDEVYKYSKTGTYDSSWDTSTQSNDPEGTTVYGEYIYIVDDVDDEVYIYESSLIYGPYRFTATYYENGTLYDPPVDVLVSGSGLTDEVNTTGGAWRSYETEPVIFTWDIGTASRRIYEIGPETITVTFPESLFDTYVFTVRDFTGKTALGDTYLEAWRVINGTDTLIERQIIDVHNEVPLNLVIGATYGIRVRYYDDSVLNWGAFVPGDSTIFTLVLRGVEITEQAYLVGNFLFVEITRPIPTQITVDYLTSRNTTIWSNVTVIIRNGAVIATQSFNNESYTYNVGGLNANTSYTVLVEGEHTLQTEWAYSRSFDGTETYPDVPNIEDIFPMGGLDASNLIAWVFTLAGGLTFSVIYRRASLVVMCAVASFFTVFGFADWGIELLAVSWFFAIMVFLGSGDR